MKECSKQSEIRWNIKPGGHGNKNSIRPSLFIFAVRLSGRKVNAASLRMTAFWTGEVVAQNVDPKTYYPLLPDPPARCLRRILLRFSHNMTPVNTVATSITFVLEYNSSVKWEPGLRNVYIRRLFLTIETWFLCL